MTDPTENVPVSWVIPWVNIIPTETVPSMRRWSLWLRILKKAWFLWTATAVSYTHLDVYKRQVIIVVPLTILLPMAGNLGTDGVFMAEPVSNVIGGAACFVTMFITVWPALKETSGQIHEKKTSA